MMKSNEELINQFYRSFQKRDYQGMNSCYADKVTFSDSVFQNLQGNEVRAMWQMLCERGKDLEIVFNNVSADAARGRAHWEARYTFSLTGKKVHNIIDAEFEFQDGKIVKHIDRFDFYRWARMALGATGLLLGWLPMVQNSVRAKARKGLDDFISRKGIN